MPLTKLSRKYHLLKRDKDGTSVMKLEHQASSKIAQVIQLEVDPLINDIYIKNMNQSYQKRHLRLPKKKVHNCLTLGN